jgi:pyrroline-5-carboxylate reductase
MKNIVLFGGGNIAQAVAEGLINANFKASNIFYIDRNLKNQKALKKLKIKNLTKYTSTKVDLFILAVKPKDAIDAYKQILNDFEDPKIVSFVAGIKSKKYLKFNQDIQFLRAMPNTSARFNLGITAIYNSSFSKNNLAKVSRLFKKIGIVMDLDNETKIDTFTGMIGSGPAYFFYLLKSYEMKLMSLCNQDKKKVNAAMVNLIKGVGSSIENNNNLDKLIEAVASKKGTTEAGLKSFKSQKLNKIFEKGISSAIKRSKEISNEF